MERQASYIVVDIGKTLSKVTAWTKGGQLVAREARPNEAISVDGIRRLDHDGIRNWVLGVLAGLGHHPIESIVPVAHGAGFVALGDNGPLFAPFDYEQTVPADVMDAYRAERDPLCVTGSPALPDGLNFGAHVYWAQRLFPDAMAQATLVPWAQYWAWVFSGVAASEVTSLGCHSDLWAPGESDFSPMAKRLGWAERFAPLVRAADVVSTIRPDIAADSGLPASVKIHAGLHDSNAALMAARGFPEIAHHEATVLSTGTWFIAMRLAASAFDIAGLPEGRDTLVNVDAFGNQVPSARFMGGREIETIIQIDTRRVDINPDQPKLLAAVPDILERGTMMLPTLAPGFGPFPDGESGWLNPPAQWTGTWYARRAAICLYAALVADVSLDLIGSGERLLVEGRFAEAQVFVRALAALRTDQEVYVANAHNDVSFGALRLIDPTLEPDGELRQVEPLEGDLAAYKAQWQKALESVPA